MVIFHNADMYPPAYENIHVVSYRLTREPLTVTDRLLPKDQSAWSHRTACSMITSGLGGYWFREHVIDPLIFIGHPVTWRNYEASYDVSELEPESRDKETYVLQEYFVPAGNFDDDGGFVGGVDFGVDSACEPISAVSKRRHSRCDFAAAAAKFGCPTCTL